MPFKILFVSERLVAFVAQEYVLAMDVEVFLDIAGLQKHFPAVFYHAHVAQHPSFGHRVNPFHKLIVFRWYIAQSKLSLRSTRDFSLRIIIIFGGRFLPS